MSYAFPLTPLIVPFIDRPFSSIDEKRTTAKRSSRPCHHSLAFPPSNDEPTPTLILPNPSNLYTYHPLVQSICLSLAKVNDVFVVSRRAIPNSNYPNDGPRTIENLTVRDRSILEDRATLVLASTFSSPLPTLFQRGFSSIGFSLSLSSILFLEEERKVPMEARSLVEDLLSLARTASPTREL